MSQAKPDSRTQFLTAEASVNENRVQVPENIRMKLYGLAKQIKEGDCRMPKPPDSNTILKAKWDAWTACQGISVDKAMADYVKIVEGLEPSVRVPLASRKGSAIIETPGGIQKKGTLYKQRDLMKGWRPRHFVLQDNLLSYYLDQDDASPRSTLDISGCSVTTLKSNTVDGVEFFPFVITHPKTGKTYNLSCDSKLETDIWVAKLLEAANAVVAPSGKDGDNSQSAPVYISSATAAVLQPNIAHDRETRAYIPEELLTKVEKNAQVFLEMLAPDAPGWELMFEKNGLVAKKRPSSQMICVRGELQLNFNLLDVWSLVVDGSRQCELDPQRQIHEKIKEYSNHTWVDYIRFKGIWPTSPRDFVNVVHWRMLNDGSVILFAFHEKFNDIRPPVDGIVRGEMALGGYWLQPNAQGTKLNYLVNTDLKGSLGSTVINFVCTAQPAILSTLRKIMTNEKAKGKHTRALEQATSYGELVTLSSNNASSVEAPSERAASAKSSSSGSASNVPPQRRATLLKNAAKLQKINIVALFILFLPALLYYVVDSRLRSAGFLGGLIIAVTYLIRLHLGEPTNKTSNNLNQTFPGGKIVYRFPAELGRLAMYLEQKIQEKELDITFTHVVVKAVAMVIQELPSINGHLIMNDFYLSKTSRVDVSLSIDMNSSQSVTYKIEDADIKPLEYIADEILQKSQSLRSNPASLDSHLTPLVKKAQELLPAFLFQSLQHYAHRVAIRFGINIPAFGIKRFPFGVCTIVSSPSVDGETDMDLAYIPDAYETSAPITVTMGGIRILPSVDPERKVNGTPVLNFAVCFNTRAVSINEGKTFCTRLQQFLNEPAILEKIHQKIVFEREEALKRKQYFGSNNK